jgi:hypothetical protein
MIPVAVIYHVEFSIDLLGAVGVGAEAGARGCSVGSGVDIEEKDKGVFVHIWQNPPCIRNGTSFLTLMPGSMNPVFRVSTALAGVRNFADYPTGLYT